MISYPNAISPVVPGLEDHEMQVAKNQPQYTTLPSLRANTADGRTMSRWTFTPEERQAIAAGADLYVTLLLGRCSAQPPIQLMVADVLGADYIRRSFDYELPERALAQADFVAVAAVPEAVLPQAVMDKLLEMEMPGLIILDKVFNSIELSPEEQAVLNSVQESLAQPTQNG